MNFFWYVLWFVIAVSLLVTVHEFGHFWVARRLGFKVLRFSVGFGRPIWKSRAGPDQTEYVLAAIPLGGYVKLLDEREGPVPAHDLPRSFTRKPPWQRIVVLLAGPGFNILFAILVLWGMFWVNGETEIRPLVGEVVKDSVADRAGLHSDDQITAINGTPVAGQRDVVFGLLDAMSGQGQAVLAVRSTSGNAHIDTLSVTDPAERRRLTEPSELFKGLGFEFWEPTVPAVLGKVIADGPAAHAGLKAGDEITAINGEPVRNFHDVIGRVAGRPGESITVTYQRDGKEYNARVTVASEHVDGRLVGRIRVMTASTVKIPDSLLLHTDLGPLAALARAAEEAQNMTVLQARLFWRMLLGQVSLKNLSGPLSIAEYAGESAQAGVAPFLGFLVLISLSLGFLNLLPVPILDGGQIVFQLAEWLKGKPLSERTQILGQQVGIALLVVLMGVALFNDIARQLN
jgi:regulator of sigma E protease